MASLRTRALRAVSAVPFLFIAFWTLQAMDLEKIGILAKPFVESDYIEWEGGKVKIIDNFYGIDFLNQMFRGGALVAATSTLGWDSVAWWQVFSFLVDLGPLYVLWILESYRTTSSWTPAYFPTVFSLVAQVLGIGIVAPLYYFLYITFGPTASDLTQVRPQHLTVLDRNSIPLLPIVLVLYTAVVFAMFCSPNLADRHFWAWALQLVPLWIGLLNVIADRFLGLFRSKRSSSASPKPILVALGLISAGVWVYILLSSPYSLSTIFLPEPGQQSEFLPHIRKAIQSDELGTFMSSLLWLAYSFFDLYSAGLIGNEWLFKAASLPIINLLCGPGATFIIGWYMRELALASSTKY
ncbi:hypothetical protein F5Y13DRAFT_198987 [Hypoxylon sp. FL1857]|nr:hypothetical protein F5Y13DRAFT_198987 [Hypoxylon sp. FL1857]